MNFIKEVKENPFFFLTCGVFVIIIAMLLVAWTYKYRLDEINREIAERNKLEGEIVEGELTSECIELVLNHNKIEKDRIDLVFIGFGYDLIGKFKSIAELALFGLGSNQKGLFDVEPFASNKERFNFWFVDKISRSEGQDLWEFSSICRKKLGIDGHKFNAQEPLFSDRMFTVIFINQDERQHQREHFYTSSNSGCSKRQYGGACGLKGVRMPMPEDDVPSWYYSDFLHNFGHAFTFYNINIEHRLDTYYEVLDEYVRFDVPYSPERDWGFILRDHSNCFVGTYEQCMSEKNTLFGDMIGDGCGKDGALDCCTNDSSAISKGARSCESCPECKEDSRYNVESRATRDAGLIRGIIAVPLSLS